jgi:hypothetical protein
MCAGDLIQLSLVQPIGERAREVQPLHEYQAGIGLGRIRGKEFPPLTDIVRTHGLQKREGLFNPVGRIDRNADRLTGCEVFEN